MCVSYTVEDYRILYVTDFGKLRTDVDRLQKDSLDYELQVDECRQAIEDLEDINSAQMKKINRALKGMERTLETLHQRQSEAGYEPLQEEVVAKKARGGELYILCTVNANTEYPRIFQNIW